MTDKTTQVQTDKEWVLALPRLVMLAVKLGFDRNVPWETKSTLGLAMLYIVSPFDGIPDFVPVLGWAEDILIGMLIIDGMVNHVDRALVLRHWNGRPETLDSIGRFTARVTRLMPDFIRNRVMKRAFPKGWKTETNENATENQSAPGRKVVDAV